jgi:hypothetical protein
MTWDATWIVASFQSTILPFFQTLPVSEKDMEILQQRSYQLLVLPTKRAAAAAGGQGFPAVPAEARRGRFRACGCAPVSAAVPPVSAARPDRRRERIARRLPAPPVWRVA